MSDLFNTLTWRHRKPEPAPSEQVELPEITWTWYVDGQRRSAPTARHALSRARAGEGFVWFGLRDPDQAAMLHFADELDLHELAVEDAVEGHRRSKLELFDDTLFVVVNTVDYVPHDRVTDTSEIVSTGQIMIFVGPGYVLTSRHGGRAQMRALRASMERDPEDLALGPWRVLYRILDTAIDDYATTVSEMEQDVEEVESAVFSIARSHEVDRPYQLKRELIEFKRAIQPLGQPLNQLATRTYPVVPEDAKPYFRELYDHHQEVRESALAMDEVLSAILQAALARASVIDNQDMRKISAAVAILAVPTAVAGIYGMNFEYMPELTWRYSYFVVLSVLALVMLALYLAFKRNRWL